MRSLYIAAYDVRHPRRLRMALNILRDFSTGRQKSVFECYLNKTEKSDFLKRLEPALYTEKESVALVRLHPRGNVRQLGIAVTPSDPDFFYVG
jgi:CRISPR-associated protein Cas2